MNPRWVEGRGVQEFLQPLREAGLDTLEFELDAYLPEWDQVQPLMRQCADLGMKLCFHAPYRKPYHIEGFTRVGHVTVLRQYKPMLVIAEKWAETCGTLIDVVVHGAVSKTADKDSLRTDTLDFLKWALEEFPCLNIALENNHPPAPGVIKAGDSRDAVLEIVKALDHPHLGICWDMGHDYLSQNQSAPSAGWLERVRHVHVHDVDENGIDHYPLVYGRVPFESWLGAVKTFGQEKIVVLEVKGGLMNGWPLAKIYAELSNSITKIKRIVQ